MTREGQDGINSDAAGMDHTIPVVAYYIDGIYAWTSAEIASFPHSTHVRIAVFWTTRDGHVIDCETGDATPAQAAQWAHQRRADGYAYPMVYTSISNQQNVINAFNAIHEPLPGWWLAHYDDLDVLPAGALGKQYANEPNLDKSIWADYIPGVDDMTNPVENTIESMVADIQLRVASMHAGQYLPWPGAAGAPGGDLTWFAQQSATALKPVLAQLAAIQGSLSTNEAALLAAIAAISGGAPTDAQMGTLTTALEAALPTYTVSIAPKTVL